MNSFYVHNFCDDLVGGKYYGSFLKCFFNWLSFEFFEKNKKSTTILDQVNFQLGSDFKDEQILDNCILKQNQV